jgi:hypothetical protein
MHKREKETELEEQREEERRVQALRSLIEEERKKTLAEVAGPALHASRCALVQGALILSSILALARSAVFEPVAVSILP